MTEIQNLLIILLILYILYDINTTKKILPKKELFNVLHKNKNQTYKIDNTTNILKYGQIQYDIIDYDNNDVQYKYQNLNMIDVPDNLTKLNKKFDSSQKNRVTNLPCQQDIIYDTKFYQPSNIYNPTDLSNINYKERKIQDVYDEIVNSNNAKIKNKKQIQNVSEFKSGASGLKTFKNIEWEYEEDDDGMSYDPNISTISAF